MALGLVYLYLGERSNGQFFFKLIRSEKSATCLGGVLRYVLVVNLTTQHPYPSEVDANSVGEQGSTFRFFVRMTIASTPLQLAPKTAQAQTNANALPLKFVLHSTYVSLLTVPPGFWLRKII